jgi:hypothetical protein
MKTMTYTIREARSSDADVLVSFTLQEISEAEGTERRRRRASIAAFDGPCTNPDCPPTGSPKRPIAASSHSSPS